MTHNEWILKSTKEREALVVALNTAAAGFATIFNHAADPAIKQLAGANFKACRAAICALVA